jgi:hypothetical protein
VVSAESNLRLSSREGLLESLALLLIQGENVGDANFQAVYLVLPVIAGISIESPVVKREGIRVLVGHHESPRVATLQE